MWWTDNESKNENYVQNENRISRIEWNENVTECYHVTYIRPGRAFVQCISRNTMVYAHVASTTYWE